MTNQLVRKITACLLVMAFASAASIRAVIAQRQECRERLMATGQGVEGPQVRALVPADQRLSSLRGEIITRVQKGEFPSVSIGVIKGDRVLWEESIGWSSNEDHITATPCLAYGLASLGKSIAGTAVMVLPALTSLVPTTSISWCLLTLPKYGLATKLLLVFRSPSLADETGQILRGSPSRSFFSFTSKPTKLTAT